MVEGAQPTRGVGAHSRYGGKIIRIEGNIFTAVLVYEQQSEKTNNNIGRSLPMQAFLLTKTNYPPAYASL